MQHPEEDLSAYGSGELNEMERKRVEEHLAVCAQCMEQLGRLQKLDEILAEQQHELEPKDDFVQRVLTHVDRDKIVPASFRNKRLTIFVAAAVIAFFVFLLSQQKGTPPVSPIVQETPKTKTVPPPAQSPDQPRRKQIVPQPPVVADLATEDAELIAHLEELQDMEIIQNLQDLDHLDLAVILADSGEMQ